MSMFGSIGLGYGQSWGGENGNYGTTASTTGQTSGSQRNNQSTNTSSTARGTTSTSTLDANTQETLRNLIQTLGANGAAGSNIASLAQELYTRGQTAEAALNANNGAIIADAARSGGQQIGRLNTELATGAGSRMNTYVAGATAEAQADLSSKLAALDAQLRTSNRATATGEMQNALQLLSGTQGQNTAQIAELANILKGANSTTTSTQSSQESQTLAALLSMLQNTQQTGQSHTDQHTSSHSSGWGIAGQLGF